MAEKTTTEALKDSFIADLLDNYVELEKTINAIPEQLKASIDALKEVIESSPAKLDNTLIQRLTSIDDLHDQLKNLTDSKAKLLDEKYKEIEISLASSIKQTIQESLQQNIGKVSQENKPNFIPIIGALLLGIFIGFIVCFIPLKTAYSDQKKDIENEYTKYIKVNEKSINSMPKNCIDLYRKNFKENL